MIIGITGKKGSGKNTSAEHISCTYGYKEMSLAHPIKEALNVIFGWRADVWLPHNKEVIDPRYGISPRQAAQNIGTEWGQFGLCQSFPLFEKTTYRSLWVNRLLAEAKLYPRVVISDVRFLHEVEAIAEQGGVILRILGGDYSDLHPSEAEMDSIVFDYVVSNDGTIQKLYDHLDAVMVEVEKRERL